MTESRNQHALDHDQAVHRLHACLKNIVVVDRSMSAQQFGEAAGLVGDNARAQVHKWVNEGREPLSGRLICLLNNTDGAVRVQLLTLVGAFRDDDAELTGDGVGGEGDRPLDSIALAIAREALTLLDLATCIELRDQKSNRDRYTLLEAATCTAVGIRKLNAMILAGLSARDAALPTVRKAKPLQENRVE